ncbi:MAG: AI-2E family transporter [Flavobacteriales bacterium]|nr:MAG: AI-2E family transporter [Flavobacteriales bacterium]
MLASGRISLERFLHLVVVAVTVWAAIWVLNSLSAVLIPFILALILDYIIDPLVDRVQRLVKHRVAAVLLTMLAVLIVVGGLLAIAIPMVGKEAKHFADLVREQLPALQARVQHTPWLHNAVVSLGGIDYHNYLTTDNLMALGKKALPGFWSGVGNVFGWLFGLVAVFTTLLYMVFLLVDEEELAGKWKTLLPEDYRAPMTALVHDLQRVMNAYFRGQLQIASILTVVYIIGFNIIGLPLATLLGVLAGALGLIPYFGLLSILPVAFSVGIYCMEHHTGFWGVMVWVVVVYIAAQALEGLVLTPRIQGKNTGLRPVVILLALSIWGSVLGLVGLLLALPLTTLLLSYYRRFVLGETEEEEGPAVTPLSAEATSTPTDPA